MSIGETFSNSIDLAVINEYYKGAVMPNARVHLSYCFSKVPLKRHFLDIYLTTFSESVISKIQNLWGSDFFKIFEIYSIFQKCTKKSRKSVFFWDNCISIRIVKFSLLRTGYFSSVGNMLTSSSKIWHVNRRDVFQLNVLGSDQSIW